MEKPPFINPESGEEQDREQHKNMGAKVLSDLSFAMQKSEGKVPDGIRDPKDLLEYQQEKEARLNEARSLIWNTYYDEGVSDNAEYTKGIKDFLNSESLKTVVDSGFNLEKMFKDGILSKADGKYLDDPIPGLAKRAALSDAETIIGDLADFCEQAADQHDSDIMINVMQSVFDDWSHNKLSANQYMMVDAWVPSGTALKNRLIYGEVIDENGEHASSTCQANHILHLIDTSSEMGESPSFTYGVMSYMMLTLYADKIKTKPDEISQWVHNDIKSAFGEAARERFDSFLHISSYDKNARDIVKSVITPHDFDLMRKAKEMYHHGDYDREPIFSDEELLSSIYDIDPSDKTEKLYGRKEVANKLPRHFSALEKAGFSRDSLLNIIHDKNVPVHAEEVERMREAGVSNVDIAYASRAYERFTTNRDGEREWHDPIDNTDETFVFREEGKEYDPAMGLSDADILNAANRNFWRNERLAGKAS